MSCLQTSGLKPPTKTNILKQKVFLQPPTNNPQKMLGEKPKKKRRKKEGTLKKQTRTHTHTHTHTQSPELPPSAPPSRVETNPKPASRSTRSRAAESLEPQHSAAWPMEAEAEAFEPNAVGTTHPGLKKKKACACVQKYIYIYKEKHGVLLQSFSEERRKGSSWGGA